MSHPLSLHLPDSLVLEVTKGWHSCFAKESGLELSFCHAQEDAWDICDKLPWDKPHTVHHLQIFCKVDQLSSKFSWQEWRQVLPVPPHKLIRNALDKIVDTFDINQIVNSLFKGKLFDQESFLFFRHFLKEIFQIAIPNFSHLWEKWFSHGLIPHICKHLSHKKIVMSHIWMLRTPLCWLKINLHLFNNTEVLS